MIAIIQGLALSFFIADMAVINKSMLSYVIIVISLTAGTAFLMWMGELITEKGIGNGISLLIFAGIVAGFPVGVTQVVEQVRHGLVRPYLVLVVLVLMLALIVCIIGLDQGQRRISVQYSKRIVGRRMYGGQATHIPMKVNQSGVIPVIFASVILTFPQTMAKFIDHPFAQQLAVSLEWGSALSTILYVIMIIAFAYFYTPCNLTRSRSPGI